jgi:two-component system, chemotaxis family, CheB/CheR fusion protein
VKKAARKSTGKIKSTLSQNTVKRAGTAFAAADASSFPVVGVGASAGGLAAVTELLKPLPPGVGAAFVLIQHLDPKHGSLTTDILSRVSPIPVNEVQNGMRIRPNHVYVIPPNRNMRLQRGVLKLSPRTEARGQHLPIDVFFRSLAEDRKEHAIGVVLSGIASDGTIGVQAIKAEGGFTFAQEPLSAQYDGMPRSAILSGAVDIVETPAGITREIVKMSSLFLAGTAGPGLIGPEPATRGPNGNLRRIFALIRSATGVDFALYKHSTIQRRIGRRLFLLKINDLLTYAGYLGKHPEEVQALFSDILIHVTGFFRDPEAYEVLKTRVLPHYLENWDSNTPLRVWVPGCSSGEEAYSIAIVFSEFLDKAKVHPSLQIFASDISEPSLQKARAGFYPRTITKDVSKLRLNRFFEKVEGGGYRISKKIRDTCLFSKHDITADPPFAKIDLISCRNVLIYFTADLQKRVFPIFHYALNPGGILWLGRSETIGGFGNFFTMDDRANKFYSKKTIATPFRLQFSPGRQFPEAPVLRNVARPGATLQDVQAEADRVAIHQYAPPGVVINDAADIMHVRGRPAPYIELTQGQANLNLFKLAHPEIVSDLRYLVNLARKESKTVSRDNLSLKKNGSRRVFGIRVLPLRVIPPSRERYFSVFFEETPAAPHAAPATKQRGKTLTKRKQKIEHQEQTAQEGRYQQELIEEYETTQEELISSNEELQSTNEELQSTNEELETAKEELQSANEEMTTINDELQTRNSDMSLLTNDLTNLLASVDIPIVMVGPDTKIRRFTPKASHTLNLIPSDIGRPIGDIKPAIQAPDLDDMVADVMSRLSMKEFETQDKHGTWYRLQVRPYRTSDNRIDGAVIALMDITDLKRSAAVLQIAHDDAKTIINTMPIAMLIIDSNRRVQTANQAFFNMFKTEQSDIEGKSMFELAGGLWNISSLSTMLETVLVQGTSFHDLEIQQDFPRIGHKDMVLHATATRLIGSGTGTATALLAIEDVTARRQAADQLRQTEEKYRHLLENANDGILIVDEEGRIEFANPYLENMFGYSSGELRNQPYEMLIPDQKLEPHRKHHGAFFRQPEAPGISISNELTGKRKDGTVFPVEISLSPVNVNSKVVVTAIVRDISERKKTETQRQGLLLRETEARQEAERISLVKDEFFATLSHELRTPLTTILSWAQTLRLGQADPEKTKRALTVIEKSAKDQGQLIDDLLDVSRIQAGKVFLELGEINPKDCIVAALDSVRSSAENKSITIQTEFDPSDCAITADPRRMEQVFRNLFTNAIKFTPPGGKITVRSKLKKDEERVEIQVEDTGKGIPPEFLPFLFTRFSQEDSKTTRAFGGLGLGLSIVRNLVEMHKGTVTAYSPGEGKGAIFTVTLPCAETLFLNGDSRKTSQSVVATLPDERLSNLSGLRVLVIDDQEDAREAFSALLQSSHARVETAASAQAGLAALPRFKPAVALCDIAMPEEDGFSFIHKVRKLDPGKGGKTPTIAVTAYASAADVRKALDAGFDAHVAKPADAIELSRLIAKLARRGTKRR